MNFASKTFFGLAYTSLVLQWLWMLTIGLPPLIRSGALDSFVTSPVPNGTGTTTVAPIEMSPLVLLFVGVTTLLVLILTVVVIIKTPRAIVNSGEKVVTQAANAVVPVVTHHHKLPEVKRRAVSRRVALALRLFATFVPAVVCLVLPSLDELTKQIIMTVALWLAIFSATGFIAAWLLEPKTPTSRTRSHASRE